MFPLCAVVPAITADTHAAQYPGASGVGSPIPGLFHAHAATSVQATGHTPCYALQTSTGNSWALNVIYR